MKRFKQTHRAVGIELAQVLPFSLDVVGVISGYSRELRLLQQINTGISCRFMTATHTENVVSDGQVMHAYSHDGELVYQRTKPTHRGLRSVNGNVVMLKDQYAFIQNTETRVVVPVLAGLHSTSIACSEGSDEIYVCELNKVRVIKLDSSRSRSRHRLASALKLCHTMCSQLGWLVLCHQRKARILCRWRPPVRQRVLDIHVRRQRSSASRVSLQECCGWLAMRKAIFL